MLLQKIHQQSNPGKIQKKLNNGDFMKKVLCLLLSLILVFAAAAPSIYAEDDAPGTDIPLIYVYGQGSHLIIRHDDGTQEKVYPLNINKDEVMQVAKDNFGIFAKAVVTQQWDEFADLLYRLASDYFKDLKLDENGNAPNGSEVDWTWSKSTINGNKTNGKYRTKQFGFYYDFRMDPYKTAEKLHQYIEDVLSVTGEEKVALLGRCLGACICSAYLEKYDAEYISDYIMYAGAMKGATQCSKAFAGELYLDSDGIERYMYDIELSADEYLNELIQSFVTLANKTGGLDLAAWSVNNVYPDIYLKTVPRVVRESYGSYPGYWSMVSDEDYEKAKETVFYGADAEKYSGFIDIIDNYHYNVQNKLEELFADYMSRGIEIADVTKYGYQTVPVTPDADILSDDICELNQASMGAVCSDITGTLSETYVSQAKADGTFRFISPDLQIDASTCFIPERTWFIKNLEHKNFPNDVDRLFDSIINNDNFTVFDDEMYPQFMVYDDGTDTISPMTQDNYNTLERYNVSFFDALKKFLKNVFHFIKQYFAQKQKGDIIEQN